MALRDTQLKNRTSWKIEELQSGFEEFFKEHGRYPTGPEVTLYRYLPTARSLERSFGGLVALRARLNLQGQTQTDFRTGAHSSARAFMINKRAHKTEQTVYEYLCSKFSKELVHREYFFNDDARTRADFFVYDGSGNFCVDVFYPSDLHNLTGCLNSKLLKYKHNILNQYPVIFLQMNSEISQESIDALLKNKKNKLSKDQQVLTWENFVAFLEKRSVRKVI